MLLLDKVRSIKDKDIAAELARWCADKASGYAATRAAAAAFLVEAAATRADAYPAFCNELTLKLKELTGDNFSYRCFHGSENIFEQLDNQIKIGCISNTKSWWLENYEEVGRENCYTADQIKEYGDYIKGENLC